MFTNIIKGHKKKIRITTIKSFESDLFRKGFKLRVSAFSCDV